MQERGLLKINKDIMDRYNFRSKVDFKVADWLTFGNNTSALYYTYKRPSSFYSWLFNRINDTNTLMTVKNPDGSWTKEGAELIGSLSEGEAQTTELSLQSQFTMTLALIKNVLSIKADATARLGNRETEQWDSDMNIPYKQGPNLADEYLGWVDMAQLAKESGTNILYQKGTKVGSVTYNDKTIMTLVFSDEYGKMLSEGNTDCLDGLF